MPLDPLHPPSPADLPAWAQGDRADLLARTRRLAASPPHPQGLADGEAAWLAFAFRASDPLLYQAAALALGRHLGHTPTLAHVLARYEEGLGRVPGAPVVLGGRRALRRLFLARAGEGVLAEAEGEGGGGGDPGETEGTAPGAAPGMTPGEPPGAAPGAPPGAAPGATPSTLHPRDLGAWLVGVRHLLEIGPPGGALPAPRAAALARALVDRIEASGGGGRGGEAAFDRILLGQIGRALVAAVQADPALGPRVRGVAQRAMRRGVEGAPAAEGRSPGTDAPSVRVAAGVHLRLLLDEGARTAVHLRRLAEEGPWPSPPGLSPGARAFFRRREALWWALEGRSSPARSLGPGDQEGELPPPVGPGGPAEPRRHRVEPVRREKDRLRLVQAGKALDRPEGWLTRSPGWRAQALFHLLDPALPLRLPVAIRAEVERVLPVSPGAALERLLAMEPEEGLALLDPRLVHGLGMATLFLAVEAEGARGGKGAGSEVASALADALEHRFRVALATDPRVRPQAFLDALEVARPSRRLVQELIALSATRAYRTAEGEVFPFLERLKLVQAESSMHQNGAAWGDPPLHELLREVGEAAVLRLPRHLRQMERARHLGEGSGAPRSRPAARARVRLLRREGRVLLALSRRLEPGAFASGAFASEARAGVALARGLEGVRRLQGALDGALPRRAWGDLPPLDALALRLASAIRELREARGARAREEDPVPALVRIEDTPLRRGLLALHLARHLALHPAHQEEGRWNDAPSLRPPSPSSPAPPPAPSPAPPPTSPSVPPPSLSLWRAEDRDFGRTLLARHWAARVQGARDAGHPRRVAALLRDRGWGEAARHPENRPLLRDLRGWLLDVHRPLDALMAGRLATGGGQGSEGLRTLGALVVRHAALWLALLVGAILMLDFGDAWKAMAEVGDWRGIGITAALGLGGAFAWILFDLRRRVRPAPEDPPAPTLAADMGRGLAFLGVTAAVTVALTGGLWFLLSGTDEVVHGAGAPLHVIAWSAFALFAGVFLGLLAKEA